MYSMLMSIREMESEEFILRERQQKVNHSRTTKVYERYQADTVKLSRDLNINGKYKYLCT